MCGSTIVDEGRGLEIEFEDATRARFHAAWLRENSRDDDAVDRRNGQKRITIGDIAPNLRIRAVEIEDGELSVRFWHEDAIARFPIGWLERNRPRSESSVSPALIPNHMRPFDAALNLADVTFEWPEVLASPAALCEWLDCTARRGFSVLKGVAGGAGMLEQVVAAFGYIRETNYGRLFDVRSEPSPINLAYTSAGLQVHTDNPYRDPVPTLQLLHCIENEADGGESVVVDGYRAALELHRRDENSFRFLTRHAVEFSFEAANVRLEARRPMIRLDEEGRLAGVHFNSRSLAPVRMPYEKMEMFYRAYRAFGKVLEAPEACVRFRLEAGELFIVDNRRVLHGRLAFSSSGRRHLQGCYADMDSLLSRVRVLKSER